MNHLYLIILSSIGFAISLYLYYSKIHNTQIYCLIGHECDAVVKSKYGKTYGIENTLIGILYYGFVLIYGILLLMNRNIFKDNLIYYPIVIASLGSVLFSVYLTAVQAFVLKKWCDYCIISSIVSVLILAVFLV